MITKSVKAEEI